MGAIFVEDEEYLIRRRSGRDTGALVDDFRLVGQTFDEGFSASPFLAF